MHRQPSSLQKTNAQETKDKKKYRTKEEFQEKEQATFFIQRDLIATIADDAQKIILLEIPESLEINQTLVECGLDQALLNQLKAIYLFKFPLKTDAETIKAMQSTKDRHKVSDTYLSSLFFSRPDKLKEIKEDISKKYDFLKVFVEKIEKIPSIENKHKKINAIKESIQNLKLNLGPQLNDLKHRHLLIEAAPLAHQVKLPILPFTATNAANGELPLDGVIKHLAEKVQHFENNLKTSEASSVFFSQSSYLELEAIWQGLGNAIFSELKKTTILDEIPTLLLVDDPNYHQYFTDIENLKIMSDASSKQLNALLIKLTTWYKQKTPPVQETTSNNATEDQSANANILILSDDIITSPEPSVTEDILHDASVTNNTCTAALINYQLYKNNFKENQSVDTLNQNIQERENNIKSSIGSINQNISDRRNKYQKTKSTASLPFSSSSKSSKSKNTHLKLSQEKNQPIKSRSLQNSSASDTDDSDTTLSSALTEREKPLSSSHPSPAITTTNTTTPTVSESKKLPNIFKRSVSQLSTPIKKQHSEEPKAKKKEKNSPMQSRNVPIKDQSDTSEKSAIPPKEKASEKLSHSHPIQQGPTIFNKQNDTPIVSRRAQTKQDEKSAKSKSLNVGPTAIQRDDLEKPKKT